MSDWIDPRIHIAGFTDGVFRIQGGKCHHLPVHDLRENKDELVVWLDEVADINNGPVIGGLKVRYLDLHHMNPAIASPAKLTNSDDPEEMLEALRLGIEAVPDPEWVWLGVQYHQQSKGHKDDPHLPRWANGVEIIEAEDPIGSFGVVGYTTRGGEKYYEFAKDYYCELLVREY
jgi:hypothetical protein